MSRTKRRIANLDPAESYKPQLVTTQYLDSNGVVRTTVHDGNFSPSPQEPTLVFVPAQFCGEIIGMKGDSHNPTQYTETNKNYLATAFISKIEQQIDAVDFVIDDNQYQASMKSRVVINDSTMGDYSQAFQAYLEQYKGTSQIVVAATELESALENGSHTIKVEYNGEESETTTFTVASADYMYFEAAEANSTVALMSMLETAPNLEYSTDGTTWQEWQHTTADGTHTFETLMMEEGDRVYFRGDNPNGLAEVGAGEYVSSSFSMTGKIKAGGNIMSLLDKTMALIEIPDSGLAALFGDVVGETPNTALVAAPDMSHVLKVGKFGCTAMFFKCINLVSAAPMDELTEIGAGGCSAMYTICTSLYSAADMPALTIIRDGGCESMYNGCTSLSSAAAIPLVNSIGAYGCESMYGDCTSLTSAADMPQLTTIGDYGCESMYNGCTFAMSNDGTTLNFAFPSPPITTAGEYPQTYSTAYDIAEWMGNTNGFTNP